MLFFKILNIVILLCFLLFIYKCFLLCDSFIVVNFDFLLKLFGIVECFFSLMNLLFWYFVIFILFDSLWMIYVCCLLLLKVMWWGLFEFLNWEIVYCFKLFLLNLYVIILFVFKLVVIIYLWLGVLFKKWICDEFCFLCELVGNLCVSFFINFFIVFVIWFNL